MNGMMILKINTVFIGNIAFDVNSFFYGKKTEQLRTNNNGGACFYSAIPSSLFYRVGIVSKIGEDFDAKVFSKYNIDTLGLQVLNGEKTTRFHQIYKCIDQKNREVKEYINSKLLINEKDIPIAYLKCKHIHITTNEPIIQLNMVKYLKQHSKAIISIDTIKGYSENLMTKEAFDLADIAFIDYNFVKLLDCKAKVKIIKYGKKGCRYISKNKDFFVKVREIETVDKTGAGDCMNRSIHKFNI